MTLNTEQLGFQRLYFHSIQFIDPPRQARSLHSLAMSSCQPGLLRGHVEASQQGLDGREPGRPERPPDEPKR